MLATATEHRLCEYLSGAPKAHHNRYTDTARLELLKRLFWALADDDEVFMSYLFPKGIPDRIGGAWDLREAQGAVDGAEYSAAARGKPCGHIFKGGEATYRCRTCTLDETCVLCSKCFQASDHEGHSIHISISSGNSGCCDCGDPEAWRLPVNCAIHTAYPDGQQDKGKAPAGSILPQSLRNSVQLTIARALDYMCDVVSCSPEQLRLQKTEENVRADERASRLKSVYYPGDDGEDESPEFSIILWNDEKHTVREVQQQVARACRKQKQFGMDRAVETNDFGRSIVSHDRDVKNLLHIAKVIEEIKITVTIRSSRDTFREQMCGTIIEWLVDIAGCSVGNDHSILRETICQEMVKAWRTGSEAYNAAIGKAGIDDHQREDDPYLGLISRTMRMPARVEVVLANDHDADDDDSDDDEGDMDDHDVDLDGGTEAVEIDEDDDMDVDFVMGGTLEERMNDGDQDMVSAEDAQDETEVAEATIAGYPPPPPPPPAPPQTVPGRTPEPDFGPLNDPVRPSTSGPPESEVPRTPLNRFSKPQRTRPSKYWLEKPPNYHAIKSLPIEEDLWRRVRLDFLIMFDLRLWKKARNDLRELYISTVVSIPHFKRLLTLRFASLYTTLAQLYLIADREPDHSVINLSVQMLTSPSITDKVVDRGNFLTNLMAILYTFLTTRQVGYPQDVQPNATLAFDSGSLTNRRLNHFFIDLRHLFSSEFVQDKIRDSERYQLQFLDLVKLHQGICPNTRAVGDHVEYETDAWISASIITRELNKLVRNFAEAFKIKDQESLLSVSKAIRNATRACLVNSVGLERKRFDQAEIKNEAKFKMVGSFELDLDNGGGFKDYRIVQFIVEKEPISFHHALHYTLSWLIDRAKTVSRDQLCSLMLESAREVKERSTEHLQRASSEDLLMILFDFPLRIFAWFAQMKAGMWVRNGLSLRHQMSLYKGVTQRDVAYCRDIFLLQTALVTCDPSRVLASIIDRFSMINWMRGDFEVTPGFELGQMVDVAEDFIHLLIILLSDRIPLVAEHSEKDALMLSMRRDIAHVLCFRPLSFSEISNRVSEKTAEPEEFPSVLDSMTRFKAPEGLSDSGTFELKEDFIEEIDPYVAQYTKNQREEAENVYRSKMSKKTGTPASDLVYEPKLVSIRSGLFTEIAAVTRTDLFVQVIRFSLQYPLVAETESQGEIPDTRLEAFLHVVLHLTLIAVLEDHVRYGEEDSFTRLAMIKRTRIVPPHITIVEALSKLLAENRFQSIHPKIRLIFQRMRQQSPKDFPSIAVDLGLELDNIDIDTPVRSNENDADKKKKLALDRQAKVMAQFQQQRKDFLENQGSIDWGVEDLSDMEEDTGSVGEDHHKVWKYPTGTCILCQEETNDSRLYGTFALIMDSNILRQTDMEDPDFVNEAATVPTSLDRSLDSIRPFGAMKPSQETLHKLNTEGLEIVETRQGLGKGFPSLNPRHGPVTTGCGHIMHYKCFETYYAAINRRQTQQIARAHPESIEKNEFLCPLCKALGNAFLPIIWRSKEESFPGALQTRSTFEDWLTRQIGPAVSRLDKAAETDSLDRQKRSQYTEMFSLYTSDSMINSVAQNMDQLCRLNDTVGMLRNQPGPSLSSPTGILPLDSQAGSPGSTSSIEMTAPMELASIYKRLRETLRKNGIWTSFLKTYQLSELEEDFTYTDSLAKSLGFSIAAAEIAQRGVESRPESTLLDKIPQQTLTLIRILSESVSSYFAIGGLKAGGANKTLTEYIELQKRQIRQLFIGHPQIFDNAAVVTEERNDDEALFSQDIFVFLSQCSVCLVPGLQVDIHHILTLCYVAEVVKVAYAYLTEGRLAQHFPEPGHVQPQKLHDADVTMPNGDMHAFKAFVAYVAETSHSGQAMDTFRKFSDGHLRLLYSLVFRYALPFLRKSTILLHARYGVTYPDIPFIKIDEPEVDRLSSVLRLPSLDAIFSSVLTPAGDASILGALISGWVRHWTTTLNSAERKREADIRDILTESKLTRRHASRRTVPRLTLSHPTVFELVGLPKKFDTLIDEAMKGHCPTTGKEISDPSICLFCGDIFCSQAFCCTGDSKLGGCNQHMRRCGRNVGMFLNLRKCTVLYLHEMRGTYATAPYLDKHGEVDTGLRRGRQLYLNQRRYDILLRNAWLNHQIPSTIARKLESDVNNGGWETI